MAEVAAVADAAVATALACCRLCAMRLCGNRNAQDYKPVREASAATGACSVCVGTLDSAAIDAICAAAVSAASAYEASQFMLNVQLSSSCAVRERAAWLHATATPAEGDAAAAAVAAAVVQQHEEVVDLKEVLRWVFTDRFASATGMSYTTEAPLQVNLLVKRGSTEEESRDVDVLRPLLPQPAKAKRKRWFNRRPKEAEGAAEGAPTGDFGQMATDADSIRAVLKALTDGKSEALLKSSFLVPAARAPAPVAMSVGVEHAPVFLTGNYVKLSRQLPQTAWVIDGARKCPTSVQEVMLVYTYICIYLSIYIHVKRKKRYIYIYTYTYACIHI